MEKGETGRVIEILSAALERRDGTVLNPKTQLIQRQLAGAYLVKGSIEPAEALYKQILTLDNNNFDAYYGLGIISAVQGKSKFSLEYFQAAQKIFSGDYRTYLAQALIYNDMRDYQKAQNAVVEGLTRFPTTSPLLEMAGQIFFNQGRYNDAINQYQPLHEASPKDRELRRKLALCYLYAGDIDEAWGLLSALRPTWATDPGWEQARAYVLLYQGKSKEAEALAAQIFNEDQRRSFLGIFLAEVLIARGSLEESEKVLDKVQQGLLPLGAGGILHSSMNDYERLRDYREAARQQNVHYLLSRGTLAQARGNYSEAEGYFERALNVDSGDFNCYYALAELARVTADPDRAIQWADRAKEIFQNHPAASLLKARLMFDAGKLSDADEDFRSVTMAYPRMAPAQALLSMVKLKSGDVAGAMARAMKAVEINEGDPNAQLALGLALAAEEKFLESDAAFRRAIDLAPTFAFARHLWGVSLKRRGYSKEAVAQFAEAARLEPMVYRRQ